MVKTLEPLTSTKCRHVAKRDVGRFQDVNRLQHPDTATNILTGQDVGLKHLRCPLSGCWVSFDGSMTFFFWGFYFCDQGQDDIF